MITNYEAVGLPNITSPVMFGCADSVMRQTTAIQRVCSCSEALGRERSGADLYRLAQHLLDERSRAQTPLGNSVCNHCVAGVLSNHVVRAPVMPVDAVPAPDSSWWSSSLRAVTSLIDGFLHRYDPLQFPGAEAALPSALAGAGAQQWQPATHAAASSSPLSNINRGVEELLRQHQLLEDGHPSAAGKLVATAITFSRNDAQSRLALAQRIQSVKGHYGALSTEPMLVERQQSIIRHWIAHNVFGQSIERFVERELIRHMDEGAGHLTFNTRAIHKSLGDRLMHYLQHFAPQTYVKNWIWVNVVLHELPILRMTDSYCASLGPKDVEWGQINAGLLLAQSMGHDIKTMAPENALALGQLLLARVKASGSDAAQEWLWLFRLPSMLRYAQTHVAQMRDRGTAVDINLEVRAMRAYFAQHDATLRENSPIARFDEAIGRYQTRIELAQEMIDDKCPGMDINALLNLSGTYCRQTPHARSYDQPEYLEDVDKKYQAQIDDIATHYRARDTLLLLSAWGALGEEELAFIGAAQITRADALFSRTHQLLHSGVVAANPHAQEGQTVRLVRDVEIFIASRGVDARIYAQKNNGNGMYTLRRVDRIADNYYPLIEDVRPQRDLDFKLIITAHGEPLKQQTQFIDDLIDAISQKHRDDFAQQLHAFGYAKTRLQKAADFALSLIPFYTCVTSIQAGKIEEAALACSLDAVSFAPVIGSLFSLQAKVGQVLATGGLRLWRNAIAEQALQQSFKQAMKGGGEKFLQHVLSPVSKTIGGKELRVLGMQSLRAIDPGLELAGSLTKKSALQIVRLGESMSDYLPELKQLLPTLRADIRTLPRQVNPTRYARLTGVDDEIPVMALHGQKYKGQDVFVKCNPGTGEPYGAKYVMDSGQMLRPIPIDAAHRLNNMRTQGLGGRGAARQSKEWAKKPQGIPARRVDEILIAGPSGRQELAGQIDPAGVDLPRSDLARKNAGTIMAVSAALQPRVSASKFPYHPAAIQVQTNDDTGVVSFAGVIREGDEPVELGSYDLEKNVFWMESKRGKKTAWFFKDNEPLLEKLTKTQMQQRVVTDEQRTAVLKILDIDVRLSLNSFFNPELEREIPKKILAVWVGNRPIEDHLLAVLQKNVALVTVKDPAYRYKIFLSNEAMAVNAERLREKVSGIEVVALEDTEIYRDFSASKNFQQYLDATTRGPGKTTNYASAVDILRLAILKHEGGLYLDVDDVLMQNFGRQPLVTRSDDSLLFSGPFIDDTNGSIRYHMCNDIIGAQPNNPALDKILDEMHKRYQRNPSFYKSRPSSRDRLRMRFYANKLFYLTGGEVITDVVTQVDPALRQALVSWSKLDQFPVDKREYFNKIFALSDLREQGEENSWIKT